MSDQITKVTRRSVLSTGLRGLGVLGLGGVLGGLGRKVLGHEPETVWQIDPDKCIMCGQCATDCVIDESAVKAVHEHTMCGYCDLCTGYFEPDPNDLNTGAENQMCPTGAIKRTFVEDPYYEYTIDEPLCIGCAKCVKGCTMFGNASLFLQIKHDRCLNCNECTIAKNCPADAFKRVPEDKPYILKGQDHGAPHEGGAH